MRLYSTNNLNTFFTLKEAVMKGLPDDNGLFMPDEIPQLPKSFFDELSSYSFPELSFKVARTLIGSKAIDDKQLKKIIDGAINFPAPLVQLDDQRYILELFHGPSLAFKDFGARFMARMMSFFNRGEDKELTILVATSGDTGGAVAAGFLKTPGIRVVILYPSGKVSPLQEKQLTTLGHNITALEVNGTFDDCQRLVKSAFLDKELTARHRLSSANSINIARLIPQSFYYFEAYKQLIDKQRAVVFSVPCGNFGNLTAGLIAKRMGLPVHQFIAATNVNDIVPQYLASGEYNPRPSVRTLSNAMDVGDPSNFARMLDMYCSTWNIIKNEITGFAYSDEDTKNEIKNIFDKYNYIIDPHGAVGSLALTNYLNNHPDKQGIIVETAHPSKFIDTVEDMINRKVEIPERLSRLANKQKVAIPMTTTFGSFKEWLMEN